MIGIKVRNSHMANRQDDVHHREERKLNCIGSLIARDRQNQQLHIFPQTLFTPHAHEVSGLTS